MKVPLLDLTRQWAALGDEIMAAVRAVFEDARFILGPRVAELETALADYCGVEGAVGVASGTDALALSLRACGVGEGEEVVTTAFSFFATASAIVHAGGRPVLVDIDPATFNLDAERLEDAVTSRTRAIVPVHLFGQTADMDPILTVAEKRGLAVVEDAAQAIGAEYQGKRAGSLGDLGALSFFPSKNLGGAGDGGLVTSDDEDLLERIRRLRKHGAREAHRHEEIGWNSRLDALQAAVIGVKLAHLDRFTAARRAHAAVYDEAFGVMDEVVPPATLEGVLHVYNQYVVRCLDRNGLRAHLAERGVGTAIYYPRPMHRQEALAGVDGEFPEADRAADEVLSLPVYPELREDEQAYVIESVKEFYAR